MPEKNSSREGQRQSLAATDEFLQAFVNDPKYARRHHPAMMPPLLRYGVFAAFDRIKNRKAETGRPIPRAPSDSEMEDFELAEYWTFMREAWMASTEGTRRYWAFKLRHKLYSALEQELRNSAPKSIRRDAAGEWERTGERQPFIREIQETPFERAIDRLEDLRGRTGQCGNPDCGAPLFIRSRKSQRYCSDMCARVFQQEAKRKWWQDHGKDWRAKRDVVTAEAGRRKGRGKKAR
jgi:hypothetical protein